MMHKIPKRRLTEVLTSFRAIQQTWEALSYLDFMRGAGSGMEENELNIFFEL